MKLKDSCLSLIAFMQSDGLFARVDTDAVNWKAVGNQLLSESWHNYTYDYRNDLSSRLGKFVRKSRREGIEVANWNEINEAITSEWSGLGNLVNDVVQRLFPSPDHLKPLADDMSWNLHAALMQSQLMPVVEAPGAMQMLDAYLAGRLPYRWEGKYPNGTLVLW